MKKLLVITAMLASVGWGQSQTFLSPTSIPLITMPPARALAHGAVVPSSCTAGQVFILDTTGVIYGCGPGLTFVASAGSGTVTSIIIAGTSNQITVTGTCTITTTGTCTLSLPSGLVLPGTINGLTITTTTGTFTLTNAKTFTVNNTLTVTATDGTTMGFPDPASVTTDHCVKFSKSGAVLGLVDAGSACGGSGTVTVVGAGTLTSGKCVTGGGSQTIQTPSSNCSVDSSGNLVATSLSIGTSPPAITPGTGSAQGCSEGTVPSVGPAVGADISYCDSTAHNILDSLNNGPYYPRTHTIFSGTKALATGAISSAACTSAQTVTATGTLTTDVVMASFNGDPTAVTGYVPLTAGMLTIIAYPTADAVNFKVCNNTSSSITPGAITLNVQVTR